MGGKLVSPNLTCSGHMASWADAAEPAGQAEQHVWAQGQLPPGPSLSHPAPSQWWAALFAHGSHHLLLDKNWLLIFFISSTINTLEEKKKSNQHRKLDGENKKTYKRKAMLKTASTVPSPPTAGAWGWWLHGCNSSALSNVSFESVTVTPVWCCLPSTQHVPPTTSKGASGGVSTGHAGAEAWEHSVNFALGLGKTHTVVWSLGSSIHTGV